MSGKSPTSGAGSRSLELRIARLEIAVGRLTEQVIKLSSQQLVEPQTKPWRCGEPIMPEELAGTSETYARYWIRDNE